MWGLTNTKKNVIDEIIRCGALVFSEVKLKSGRSSPYFFNVARMFNPQSLNVIGEAYAKTIVELLSLDGFDGVFGPSYKGIPLAVATSFKIRQLYGYDKPILYDRKEAKSYGVKEDERIVGSIDKGARLVIVDDVLTTGLTKLKVKEALEELGFKVVGVVVLMDRNEMEDGIPASEVIRTQGLKYQAIIEAVDLFQVIWARRSELRIDPSIFRKVKDYYEAYGSKKLFFDV
ncbi:MAG: orotate phosphoribosyltransferase [Candidatus Nezhaarchaeales archaeon]